jgi:hypothetical protein
MRNNNQILDDVCMDCTENIKYTTVDCVNCPVHLLKEKNIKEKERSKWHQIKKYLKNK